MKSCQDNGAWFLAHPSAKNLQVGLMGAFSTNLKFSVENQWKVRSPSNGQIVYIKLILLLTTVIDSIDIYLQKLVRTGVDLTLERRKLLHWVKSTYIRLSS